jgi:membrane protease YdiL (CAAX protease family)
MSNATTKLKSIKAPTHNVHASANSKKLHNKATWNPVVGVGIGIVVFFGAQLISELLLSYYRYPRHWSTQQVINWLSNSITAQFLFILIAESLVVAGVCFFVSRYKNGLKVIGLRRPRWSDPLYGLIAVPVYLVLYFIAVAVVSHFVPSLNVNEKQQLGFNNVSGVGEMTLTFISLVVLPPIAEEILFRGLIYSSLKKNLPIAVALTGSSLLVAFSHYTASIFSFIFGCILIFLCEVTGRLWIRKSLPIAIALTASSLLLAFGYYIVSAVAFILSLILMSYLWNDRLWLRKIMPVMAVVGTSLTFAVGHLPEGGSSGPLYIAAIDTFILSLVLIYLREKTGRLWASMTLHALKNTIAYIALYIAFIHLNTKFV